MQYAIVIYETAEDFSARTDPAKAGEYWGGWTAYVNAMNSVTTGGAPLNPPATATTVRLKDGKRHVQDGPFAEAKEQLAGIFMIDVPDLDAALDWAARCPAAVTGAVEVRPIMQREMA